MEVFEVVINFCVNLLNTSLTFGNFSFTFGQCWLGLACMGIVIAFISKLFDRT